MHECYAMQILETKKKKIKQNKTKQKAMVTKSRAMKHKDYVKKTHLN